MPGSKQQVKAPAVIGTTHGDDLCLGALLPQGPHDCRSVHPWQEEIAEKQIGLSSAQRGERFLAGTARGDLEPSGFEHCLSDTADESVILDEQDKWHRGS